MTGNLRNPCFCAAANRIRSFCVSRWPVLRLPIFARVGMPRLSLGVGQRGDVAECLAASRMRALVQGLARKDVANRLGLSVHTVGTMCKRGYAKLGVRSHAELVAKLAGGET